MLQLQAEVKQKKRFPARGRDLSLLLSLSSANAASIPIASVLERLLLRAPQIIPPLSRAEVREEDGKVVYVIRNFRGRPAESFAEGTTKNTNEQDHRSEEFFHSDGRVLVPPHALKDFPDQPESLESIPFRYQVNSTFDRFTEQGEILHRVEALTSNVISTLMPAEAAGEITPFMRLTRSFPLTLDQIRIGFETYRTRYWGARFGVIPGIRERLYLEMTPSRFYLIGEEEKAPHGASLPMERSGIYEALERTFEELHLYTGLLEALRSHAS